jgi:cobalt transporter subunit CbtA
VDRFRILISVALVSGTMAGLFLFVVQHFAIFPLIEKAEVYESAAAEHTMHGMHQEDEAWRPSSGAGRTLFTAPTTVLSAIRFAALLFGTVALKPVSLNWRKGALWGLAAFVCVDLAPALGLPPQPPGVAVADLSARQLWWVATVGATAIGLFLLFSSQRPWPIRLSGLLGLILPHVIGAPVATGGSSVPQQLVHQFALLSILTTGMFWIVLGSIGGLVYQRSGYSDAQ